MQRLVGFLLFIFSALALIAVACDGGGDFLLDEGEPDATSTPPIFQRTPPPSPEPSPEGSPPAAGATPVASFKITVTETVNRRSEPSSEGGQATVSGTLGPDETATVTARIPGEAVAPDNDIWYQLDDGSFVYSGAVTKVEE